MGDTGNTEWGHADFGRMTTFFHPWVNNIRNRKTDCPGTDGREMRTVLRLVQMCKACPDTNCKGCPDTVQRASPLHRFIEPTAPGMARRRPLRFSAGRRRHHRGGSKNCSVGALYQLGEACLIPTKICPCQGRDGVPGRFHGRRFILWIGMLQESGGRSKVNDQAGQFKPIER